MTHASSNPASSVSVRPLSIAVLISGTGSNLSAIGEAIEKGDCAASIAAVISDRPTAPGLAWADQHGLPTRIVRPKDFSGRAAWDIALAEGVAHFTPDLVVLAGFMRIVGEGMLARFPRRILNVHPSLLPAFPGIEAPSQALAAGVRISGCTVHLVDRGVDTGPIVAQAAVPVLPDDDVARLHARIQRIEHALLPAVIDGIARRHIQLEPTIRYLQPMEGAMDAHLVYPPFPVRT